MCRKSKAATLNTIKAEQPGPEAVQQLEAELAAMELEQVRLSTVLNCWTSPKAGRHAHTAQQPYNILQVFVAFY